MVDDPVDSGAPRRRRAGRDVPPTRSLLRARHALLLVCGVAAGTAGAARVPDHSTFDALLRENVVQGFVDYQAFQRAPAFAAYVESLSRVTPETLPEADRLAFWLNAYNAWTIQLVNMHGERESIRNIGGSGQGGGQPGRPGGPWTQPIARLGGRMLSLDQIVHDVIRRQFQEPRIHFALVCAAAGCPPLRSEAYLGTRLDEQLDDQARIFLDGSPEKNRVDVAARVVYLSPVFDWYRGDFGGTDAALGRFLAKYQSRLAARRLLERGTFEIRWTTYDWSLNDRYRLAATPHQIYERMLLFAGTGETEKLRRAFSLVEPLARAHASALGRPTDDVERLIQSADSAERLRGTRKLVAHDIATLLLGAASAPPDRVRTLVRTASLEWGLLQAASPAWAKVATKLNAAVTAIDAERLAEARATSVAVAREIIPLF